MILGIELSFFFHLVLFSLRLTTGRLFISFSSLCLMAVIDICDIPISPQFERLFIFAFSGLSLFCWHTYPRRWRAPLLTDLHARYNDEYTPDHESTYIARLHLRFSTVDLH